MSLFSTVILIEIFGVAMNNTLEFDTLKNAIVEDFLNTSGYNFDFRQSSSKDFVFQIDPMFLLNIIVSPIVKQIIEYIGKRLTERKTDTSPVIAESEIREIRELVRNFEHDTGMSQNSLYTPELANKMADSIERVLRQNPRALLKSNHKQDGK